MAFSGQVGCDKICRLIPDATTTREKLLGSGLFGSCGGCRDRRNCRIDPARTDTVIKQVGGLLVFLLNVALPHDAAEADLDVLARAAEPVVEIEMPKCGVEVVAPHQADRACAEPDAFGAGRRAAHDAARLGNFVSAA